MHKEPKTDICALVLPKSKKLLIFVALLFISNEVLSDCHICNNEFDNSCTAIAYLFS